jgi:hypothetical protein
MGMEEKEVREGMKEMKRRVMEEFRKEAIGEEGVRKGYEKEVKKWIGEMMEDVVREQSEMVEEEMV